MQTQLHNRTDAEIITLAFKNVDGSGSITTGAAVALVSAGASIDGISSVNATGALIKGFCGVAKADVAINDFGKATAWGLANSVLISHVGTSITITAGDTLKPGAVAGTFFSSLTDQALSTLLYRYVYTADTVTVSARAFVRGIVKAL